MALLPEEMRARLSVTQQARDAEAETAKAAYAAAGVSAEIAVFFEDMPRRIAEAHLVISRSGASTMAELTAIGRPAILCPYPHAMDDHQTANAQPMAAAGAAVSAPQDSLTAEGLAAHVAAILGARDTAAEMAAAARALGRPEAAAHLADLVEATGARRTTEQRGETA